MAVFEEQTTPLAAIEQAVQARAKDVALDLSGDESDQVLRDLIEDEVAQWNLDYRRGTRPHDLPTPETIAERAFRNLARYGPLTPLLDDDDVWEIMINSPDTIMVKRHRGTSGYHDEVFHDDDHVIRTLTKILDEASGSHRKLDPAEGLQDAQLDTGARLHIVHGDLSRGGHIMANIRKFTGVPFRSLEQLVERNMLSTQAAGFLRAAIRADLTVVFAGAPGSGKTTLLSCCAAEIDPGHRVVVAEEVFEADIPLPNVAQMQTRAARSDRPPIDLRRLVAGFLRMAPDFAIVGEVRDREALPRSPYPPLTSTYAVRHIRCSPHGRARRRPVTRSAAIRVQDFGAIPGQRWRSRSVPLTFGLPLRRQHTGSSRDPKATRGSRSAPVAHTLQRPLVHSRTEDMALLPRRLLPPLQSYQRGDCWTFRTDWGHFSGQTVGY